MGIVRMGPPAEIILKLRDTYNISHFIETVTYSGDTAFWASKIFQHVSTIEFSESTHNQVANKFNHIKNIEFLYGDTRNILKDIVSKLNAPSIFWLDAHWSGGQTYGYKMMTVPDSAKLIISQYGQDINTKFWEDYSTTNFKKGLKLICQDMKRYIRFPQK